jgi:hypothetical protein
MSAAAAQPASARASAAAADIHPARIALLPAPPILSRKG